ncbi:hypothetical protein Vretimale_15317 [Volvox reticuliferus]|uniref:Uncharacterized protein n=1 Tax=Volvox reticuliferus TaxID=1737510 RepID=A0A8J4CX42_9CHLO|nr:hypothetical protein Vretifemale_16509 [Volvox reticuliferus]GIM11862.1 hypothetical protein Vretimale_15317 [Volvox reticuliferus]
MDAKGARYAAIVASTSAPPPPPVTPVLPPAVELANAASSASALSLTRTSVNTLRLTSRNAKNFSLKACLMLYSASSSSSIAWRLRWGVMRSSSGTTKFGSLFSLKSPIVRRASCTVNTRGMYVKREVTNKSLRA